MEEKTLIQIKFQDLDLEVQKDEKYEWLLETNLVAKGYEVVPSAILNHKMRKTDELFEGQHWVSQFVITPGGKQAKVFWTKEGVIYLGFFIKSERAKLFRKWASKLILNHIENRTEEYVTVKMLKENNKLLKAIIGEMSNAVYTLLGKKINNIQEELSLIKTRLELLENHFSIQKQLEIPQRIAYVYVLNKVGTNEYKIGKSVEPLKRKSQLEQGGVKLELTLSIKFKTEELALLWENTLQVSFKSRHLSGEWYALDENQLNFLLELAKAQESLF